MPFPAGRSGSDKNTITKSRNDESPKRPPVKILGRTALHGRVEGRVSGRGPIEIEWLVGGLIRDQNQMGSPVTTAISLGVESPSPVCSVSGFRRFGLSRSAPLNLTNYSSPMAMIRSISSDLKPRAMGRETPGSIAT